MDFEWGVRLWGHGILLNIILTVVTIVFAFFGLTFSFALLGESIGAFIFIAFIVLPLLYGWVSRFLSELFHNVEPSEVDSWGDTVILWLHGLGLVVIMLLIATAFGALGLTLTLETFMNVFADLGALVFAVLSITVIPVLYGFVSQGLTELLA